MSDRRFVGTLNTAAALRTSEAPSALEALPVLAMTSHGFFRGKPWKTLAFSAWSTEKLSENNGKTLVPSCSFKL